jgi:CRISPR-associated protein Cmr3
MTTYLIDPKAPLLFRDGRPFGDAERAETLPFPLPSTLVGAFRTAYGDARGLNFATQKDEVLKFRLAGPLLARRTFGGTVEPLFPKPADAMYFKEETGLRAVRLAPQAIDPKSGEGTDLEDVAPGLLPVRLQSDSKSKPAPGAAFWNLKDFTDWLANDQTPDIPAENLGVRAMPVDIRTHVALQPAMDGRPATFASRDGYLFQTAGLDFGPCRQAHQPGTYKGWESEDYGLLVRVAVDEDDNPPTLNGLRTVGGERRPAWIEQCPDGADPWPQFPDALRQAFRATPKGVRLTLVTPALFKYGWRPDWLDGNLEGTPPGCSGLKLKLRAAALDRWQAFSGWDMQPNKSHDKRPGGAARAVRRMVPAGAVYWFEIVSNSKIDATAQAALIEKLWLTSLCDQDHDRRDGFGLAVPGVWSVRPATP